MLYVTISNGKKIELHVGQKFQGNTECVASIQADGDELNYFKEKFKNLFTTNKKVERLDGMLAIVVMNQWVDDF
jgi:hypothetical protein